MIKGAEHGCAIMALECMSRKSKDEWTAKFSYKINHPKQNLTQGEIEAVEKDSSGLFEFEFRISDLAPHITNPSEWTAQQAACRLLQRRLMDLSNCAGHIENFLDPTLLRT